MSMRLAPGFGGGAAALVLAGCAATRPAHDDGQFVRVEVLALLQTANADLLGHSSATLTLERWCADHRLAKPARIIARHVRGADKPLPDALRARLELAPGETVGYRHVRLTCGDHVLSEADNWYVPSRLTPEMNRVLETTEQPFGKVVRPLRFHRRTLSAELLWSPLPAGWELGRRAAPVHGRLHVPRFLLRHEAILYSAAQKPFSAVVENYTNELLAFGIDGVDLAKPRQAGANPD